MAQTGGLKAAAKRTAFGDLSNAANVTRPSKDDSAILTKANVTVTEKHVALLPQEKKTTAFSRPAQRPLSVSGLKSLLHNVAGPHGQTSVRQTPIEPQQPAQPAVQQANTKKAAREKSTVVFTDAAISYPDPTKADKDVPATAPLPPVHRELPSSQQPREEKQPLNLKPSSEHAQDTILNVPQSFYTAEEPAIAVPWSDETAPLRSDGIYIDNHGEIQHYVFADENDDQEDQAPEAIGEARDTAPTIDPRLVEKVDQYLKDREQERQADVGSRSKLPPVSEPEESWDQEDGDYEEEGYVTARSFKSRGENTTNGVTTVVFPKVNQKIKKELATAKELIESTKTAEEIDDETWDTSMVAEYGEEIFGYMRDLEVQTPCR